MKIIRIYIENFGKFKNYTLKLYDGMNILAGENEAGKSTIMAFIELMFYGRTPDDKSQDIYKNLRKKYSPWDGGMMSGELEFEHNQRTYRISKRFGRSNKSDEVNIFDVDGGREIVIGSNSEVGEYFFGIDVESFEKSIFINTLGSFIKAGQNNEDIAIKLANISTALDEEISHIEVMNRLNNALEQLISKNKKKGIIPELEEKRDECVARLDEANIREEKLKESLIKKNKITKEIEALTEYRKYLNLKEKKDAIESQLRTLDMTIPKLKKVESLKKELAERKNRFATSKYDFDSFMQYYDKVIDRKRRLVEKEMGQRVLLTIIIMMFFVTLIVTMAGIVGKWGVQFLIFMSVLTAAFLVLSIFVMVRFGRIKREISNVDRRLDGAYEEHREIHKLQYSLNNDVEDEELNEIIQKRNEKEQEKQLIQDKMKLLRVDDYNLTRIQKSEDVDAQIKIYNDTLIELSGQIGEIKESSEKLKEEVRNLNKKIEEKKQIYKSLELARACMQDAIDEAGATFGPILNRKVSDILIKLTNGRYENVTVAKDYDVKVKQKDSGYRDWRTLSSGTIDQIYFALRIAMSQIITENDDHNKESYPVVMDDVLIQYDDNRMREALEFLLEYSKTGQVIMFTCHFNNIKNIFYDTLNQINIIKLEQ